MDEAILEQKLLELFDKGDLVVENGIQSQYRESNVKKLIDGIRKIKKKYLTNAFISLYKDNISLSTAKGDGLDLWGVLINFGRFVLVQITDPNKPYYYELNDNDYKNILMVLHQKQFVIGNIDEINRFTQEIFGEYGNIKVKDTYDMSFIVYEFNQVLPAWLKWTLNNNDILLRPAGVGVKIEEKIDVDAKNFGFAPSENDKDTDPTAYEKRVAWFDKNIGNFDNTSFKE